MKQMKKRSLENQQKFQDQNSEFVLGSVNFPFNLFFIYNLHPVSKSVTIFDFLVYLPSDVKVLLYFCQRSIAMGNDKDTSKSALSWRFLNAKASLEWGYGNQ